MKIRNTLPLLIVVLLAGCAGGDGVREGQFNREGFKGIAALKLSEGEVIKLDGLQQYQVGEDNGAALIRVEGKSFAGKKEDKLFLQTPDGRLFKSEGQEYSRLPQPFEPASSDPNQKVPSVQDLFPVEGGGNLILCCTTSRNTENEAFNEWSSMTMGAWRENDKTTLLVGGIETPVDELQGVTDTQPTAIGKATYAVWAIREKEGNQVAISTIERIPKYTDAKGIQSYITVNFNTGKIGGKILGNKDFGDDIDLDNVVLNGNQFSGTATSGTDHGVIEGKLFGHAYKGYYSSTPGGSQIGGKVDFGKKEKDAVFGGSRVGEPVLDKTVMDLNPVK